MTELKERLAEHQIDITLQSMGGADVASETESCSWGCSEGACTTGGCTNNVTAQQRSRTKVAKLNTFCKMIHRLYYFDTLFEETLKCIKLWGCSNSLITNELQKT
jgi:hypothetical protein